MHDEAEASVSTQLEIARRLISRAATKGSNLVGNRVGQTTMGYRIGRVSSVQDGLYMVELLDTGSEIPARSTQEYKVGDVVKVVKQGNSWFILDLGAIEAQLTEQGKVLEDFADALGDLSSQVDGVVNIWYGTVTPTASNEPAVSWTDEEKVSHTGDLYYNTTNGYSYRWTGSSWAQITDERITEALEQAQNAVTAADGKAQIFTTTPRPPYQVGDLWVQGSTGEIMACYRTRYSGSYVASDWRPAAGWTDDAKIEEVVDTFNMTRTVATVVKTLDAAAPAGVPEVDTTYWWVFTPTDATYAPKIAFATIPISNLYTSRTIGSSGRYISNYLFKIKWPTALGSLTYDNLPICLVGASGSSSWCDAIVYNRDTTYLGPIAVARDYDGAACGVRLEIMVVTRG